ncbi:MAG TPA: pyridoxamine 5'-phosphate oxidase [Thermopetrobacter sp.]|nr:pyridoxamine 5'-phosphate oxidase [Thermopetrobacter sp.]
MADPFDDIRQLLAEKDFAQADDPIALFGRWFAEAKEAQPVYPEAMALATVDENGLPDVRMVLLKDFDEKGFVFYTNMESAKGRQLAANPRAALNFWWPALHRQVRIRGPVEPVPDEEADAYFASRPRGSRIGAWASKQSRPLESRRALEKAVAAYAAKFHVGAVPRPPYWTGQRVVPLYMEFWHERPFRLHERVLFARDDPAAAWRKTRLYP